MPKLHNGFFIYFIAVLNTRIPGSCGLFILTPVVSWVDSVSFGHALFFNKAYRLNKKQVWQKLMNEQINKYFRDDLASIRTNKISIAHIHTFMFLKKKKDVKYKAIKPILYMKDKL